MSNINIRINSEIKTNAEAVFEKLGLTPTTAITLFYNQVIRTNSIPFELKVDVPNEKTMKAIKEVEEMENGKIETKTYDNIDEFMEDLIRWSIL